MALFESYERRINQINKTLNEYGIASIDEAKALCDEKVLTFMKSLNLFNLFVLKMHVGLIL